LTGQISRRGFGFYFYFYFYCVPPAIRFLFLFYFISSHLILCALLSVAVVLPSPERCVRGVSVWWVFGIYAARYLNLGVKNGLLGVELIR
jgi:hypothetical protein